MALKKILVDSGFLYVLYNSSHVDHDKTQNIVNEQVAEFIVPYVVLTEVAYLFKTTGGTRAVARFLETLVKAKLPFEPVMSDDLTRAREIMLTYDTARLDFVDCCLMALSERLNITEVCTLDRRDFQIFRPRHCNYLTLLP